MPLAAGTRLGPYEIVSPLGAGGMGEVYRARDSRLGRDVAIKVLPPSLTGSAEVRARFEREARTVSSLNHPHICTLHDVGREGDTDFLVMELIDGETLAQRLTRGPLPPAEVLKLGAQIADALDRAHRAGVIHRDLKPGNIMLTRAGAKLMDFGLARATGLAGPGQSGVMISGMSQSPTMAAPLTAEGTIVGTFQYMAPEQLEGREADARADIWALGCVLYEMATGTRAFEGKSQASLISAIMKDTPRPIGELTPMSPPALDRVVRRCLAKDPDDRWQSARDVGLELHDLPSTSEAMATGATRAAPKAALLAWGVAAAALIALAATLVLWRAQSADRPPAVHLEITRSLSAPFVRFVGTTISPDSRNLVLVGAVADGSRLLYLRPVDSDQWRPLEGTEGGAFPFWSPDGRDIAFFADGKLKRISVAGGPAQVLADVPTARGGSWGTAGSIVVGQGSLGAIAVVPEHGGTPRAVTKLTPKDEAHRWPCFLADGRHFIFLADANRTEDHWLRIGSIDGGPPRDLLQNAVTNAVFVAPHWLFFVRSGALLAQRFDPGAMKLSGEPVSVARQLAQSGPNHLFEFSVARSGVLVYRSVSPLRQLVWFDRAGHRLSEVGKPQRFRSVRLAPDGRSIAYGTDDADGRAADLWLLDPARGMTNRLTSDPASDFNPVWSPSGDQIAFGSYRRNPGATFVTSTSGGGGDSLLMGGPRESWAADWSADGRWLLLGVYDANGDAGLYAMPADHSDSARAVVAMPGNFEGGRFSPDGHWIAYASSPSGPPEIYVQDFPAGRLRRQVSANAASVPNWASGGREIIFQTLEGGVVSAAIGTARGLTVEAPQTLFTPANGELADVTADGQKFLVLVAVEDPLLAPVHVVTDWRPRR